VEYPFAIVDVFATSPLGGNPLAVVAGPQSVGDDVRDASPCAPYARFFNPTVGLWEDPATGTAAGPLACYLVRYGRATRGSPIYVEQGHAMGRPSRIELRVTETAVTITGRGIVVAEGLLRL